LNRIAGIISARYRHQEEHLSLLVNRRKSKDDATRE